MGVDKRDQTYHFIFAFICQINSHKEAITVATFAPDGTALATASLDGEVKFFQVYLPDKKEPRCLHQWKPHDGRPVSSLLFLDDHQTPNPSMHFCKLASRNSFGRVCLSLTKFLTCLTGLAKSLFCLSVPRMKCLSGMLLFFN